MGSIRSEELSVLLELTSLLQASTAEQQSLRPVLDLVARIIPYESATLYLLDDESGELVQDEMVGDTPVNLIDVVRFDMGFGLSAWIAQQRRPIILPVLGRRRNVDAHRVQSYVGLPLVVEDELLGVMNFGHSTSGAFHELEETPLRLLAGQLAQLIHNMHLVRDLRTSNAVLAQRNRQLRDMQGRLVESERLKAVGELIATMNHEINNPLTIINGSAELLSLQLLDSDEGVQDKLRTILAQVRRLGRVLNMLANIRKPVTETYTADSLMLDLRASARGDEDVQPN